MGLFSGSDMDILCIQAIYMPLIRKEVFDFVDSWNNHYIRRQPNRPQHPTGRPWMMYFHPEDNVPTFGSAVNNNTLQLLQNDVAEYGKYYSKYLYINCMNIRIDLDLYLPTDIIKWVTSILARHGRQIPEAWTDDHLSIYQLLRLEVQKHIDIGNQYPTLRLLPTPVQPWTWQPLTEVKVESTEYSLDACPIDDEEWIDVREAMKDELVVEESNLIDE